MQCLKETEKWLLVDEENVKEAKAHASLQKLHWFAENSAWYGATVLGTSPRFHPELKLLVPDKHTHNLERNAGTTLKILCRNIHGS